MPRADASRRRCAIYTRKSSEEGLEQEFNSLAAQREACEAFIRSQRNEGWVLARLSQLDPDLGNFADGLNGNWLISLVRSRKNSRKAAAVPTK